MQDPEIASGLSGKGVLFDDVCHGLGMESEVVLCAISVSRSTVSPKKQSDS